MYFFGNLLGVFGFFSPQIKMSESFRYIISFMTVQNVSESGVSRFSEGKGQNDGTTGTIL